MRHSAIKPSIIILLILINFSCRQSDKVSQSASTTEVNTSDTNQKPLKFKSQGIHAIYSSYINLRDALVATDIETVKKYALELKTAFEKEDKLQEASIVAVINETTEVEVARESFYNLNEILGPILSENIASGQINKCYCPMARDNQGASWFTTGQDILNPYFGDKMLKCGSIKETLVAL